MHLPIYFLVHGIYCLDDYALGNCLPRNHPPNDRGRWYDCCLSRDGIVLGFRVATLHYAVLGLHLVFQCCYTVLISTAQGMGRRWCIVLSF